MCDFQSRQLTDSLKMLAVLDGVGISTGQRIVRPSRRSAMTVEFPIEYSCRIGKHTTETSVA